MLFPAITLAVALAGCGGEGLLDGSSGSSYLLASSISAGGSHTCAVSGGAVKCWGRGSSGQLGNGLTSNSPVAALVTGLTGTPVEVSAGDKHTCARLSTGRVWCWGENSDGQLGNGTFIGSAVPVQVSGITTATAISAGGNHTCALLADGTLACWGNNVYGQLGNDSSIDSNTPVSVTGITTASSVASGGSHTCATLTDGTARCWGSNAFEQLGNAALVAGGVSRVPVVVTALSGALEAASGANHSCARVTSPSTRIRCWGNNAYGQLGSAWTLIAFTFVFETTSNEALYVNYITSPSGSLAAGTDHSCAVLTDGSVRCWGDNFYGQLGNGGSISGFISPGTGAPATSTVAPVQAGSIGNAALVASGQFHSCARLSSGRVLCWGSNAYGQLGDGTYSTAYMPVAVGDVP